MNPASADALYEAFIEFENSKDAYVGEYFRRWGIPLIDGGTVRLLRIIGQGRALEIILTGRKVMSDECLNIGLCEYVVEDVNSRKKAEEIAKNIAKFPQECVRADRHSTLKQHNLTIKEGLFYEWNNSMKKKYYLKTELQVLLDFLKVMEDTETSKIFNLLSINLNKYLN